MVGKAKYNCGVIAMARLGLVSNSITNFISFGLVGFMSLIIISLVVSDYGVGGYGLIVVSRLILPTGIIALLDFGLPEATTKLVAYNRDNTAKINGTLFVTFIVIALISSFIALTYYWLSDDLTNLLGISSKSDWGIVKNTFHTTALFMIPLFLGLIVESILKGIEKFFILRLGELLMTVCFLALVYADDGNSIDDIIYFYLILMTIKYFAFYVYLVIQKEHDIKFTSLCMDLEITKDHFQHSFTVMKSKAISLVYWNFAPIYLTVESGLDSLGIYDVVMKIPKLLKSVLGQINTVVLPYISKMDSNKLEAPVKRLIIKGVMYETYIFLPLILCAVYSSDRIMWALAASKVDEYSSWLSFMFVWTSLYLLFSFGATVAVARNNLLKKFNKISLYMTFIYLLFSFILLPRMDVKGLFVAMFFSLIIATPFFVSTLIRDIGLKAKYFIIPAARVLIISLVPLSVSMMILSSESSIGVVIFGNILSLLFIWFLISIFFVPYEDRALMINNLKNIFIPKSLGN